MIGLGSEIKIKQFWSTGDGKNDIDRRVNEWLDKNPDVQILELKQGCIEFESDFRFGVYVFLTYKVTK
jgi:hypothetical protein